MAASVSKRSMQMIGCADGEGPVDARPTPPIQKNGMRADSLR